MKPAFGAACLAFLVAAPALRAAEPAAHQHGVAALRVVVDGPDLRIELESPLDSLLGFERAPRSDAERDAVRQLAAQLRGATPLFGPTPAARCTLVTVSLHSAVLPPALLGEAASPAAAPAEPGEHADLDADFHWRCEAPAALTGLDLGLMQAFPGLRTLNVEVAGPRGQSALKLTGGQRRVAW